MSSWRICPTAHRHHHPKQVPPGDLNVPFAGLTSSKTSGLTATAGSLAMLVPLPCGLNLQLTPAIHQCLMLHPPPLATAFTRCSPAGERASLLQVSIGSISIDHRTYPICLTNSVRQLLRLNLPPPSQTPILVTTLPHQFRTLNPLAISLLS